MAGELERDVLFAVIRAGLGQSVSVPPITDDVFEQLIRFGKRQSLFPIIWQGIQTLCPDNRWAPAVQTDLFNCITRNVWRENGLKTARRALDGANIPYVLLKGAVIQHLYPEPWMRTSSDIDILVPEEDLDAAVRAMEENTAFKAEEKGYHDVSMMSDNYHLELHFSLKEREEKLDPLLAKAWDYTVPAEEGSCRRFTPEYELFYVVAHMEHHFIGGGLGVRPFIDLWLLLHKTDCDKDALNALLDACGLTTFFDTCRRLCAAWFDGAEHDDATALLEKYCLSGGVLGSDALFYVARQRKNKGWRYVLSRVWIPKDELISSYGDEGEAKHSTLYYQVKRWNSWVFRKDRQQELKGQIDQLQKVPEEAITEFNKLVDMMDL